MSRTPLAAVLTALALASWVTLSQSQGDSPARALLAEATAPADLRARLLAHAEARLATDRAGAGEAWNYSGWSHWRGGQPDSAILAWRRALELRGDPQDRYDLADALLERRAPGDIDEAVAMLETGLPEAQAGSARTGSWYRALLGWGHLLAGDEERARERFAEMEPDLTKRPLWRYRMGRAALTGPDTRTAIILLRTLAVASRAQDAEVMRLLESAAQRLGQPDAMLRDLTEKIAARDRIEDAVVSRVNGRRIKFTASDGFPLSGVLLESKRSGRHRTAIVVLAPEDTLADFDSLGIALRESGLHTLLLQPRGSGWSAAPACPLPVAWRGREQAMLERTALDVGEAVRAVRLATRNADTTTVVVAASRSVALAGALAAGRDRRVRALVLLSPEPDAVDAGAMLAALARRPLPLFLQQTSEDFPNFAMMERAYQAADRPASRVSEARVAGRGAAAFKFDPRVTPRFVVWLESALAPPAKKATPPARPRKG